MGSQIKKADLSRPRKTLEALYRKKLKLNRLDSFSPYYKVGKLMRGEWKDRPGDKRGFYEFLSAIARRHYYRVFYQGEALLAIYGQTKHWLKSPKGWMPKSIGNAGEILQQDLIDYLFVRYEVPQFMYQAWQDIDPLHISWFIHLAQGQNIRTAPGMQAHLTKKMAHEFLQAPTEYRIEDALIYGQVMAMGGRKSLVKKLSLLSTSYLCQDQEMWLTLLRLFINNPELEEDQQVDRIVNYLNDRRLVKVQIDAYGQLGPQVTRKVSLKGKTAKSLMREVKDWENSNRYGISAGKLVTWTPNKVRNFLYRANKADQKSPIYRIMQLTNNYAIEREGEVMRHCVGSYLHRCESGDTSIWSLTATTCNGVKPLLTIQLHEGETIVQVRGKANSMPGVDESKIVRQWAKRERLKVANYCELE
ncbi:hypothetical protein BKI52_25065 [marine bacterium AO1-C]|nr:hypothetical protein BKI52_25065 [marine bacterium AO1-C]